MILRLSFQLYLVLVAVIVVFFREKPILKPSDIWRGVCVDLAMKWLADTILLISNPAAKFLKWKSSLNNEKILHFGVEAMTEPKS